MRRDRRDRHSKRCGDGLKRCELQQAEIAVLSRLLATHCYEKHELSAIKSGWSNAQRLAQFIVRHCHGGLGQVV